MVSARWRSKEEDGGRRNASSETRGRRSPEKRKKPTKTHRSMQTVKNANQKTGQFHLASSCIMTRLLFLGAGDGGGDGGRRRASGAGEEEGEELAACRGESSPRRAAGV